MAVINKTGISNGGTIQAEHITRAIDALSGGTTDSVIATGSFTGSFTGNGSGLTGITATSAAGVDLTNTTTGTGPYYPIFSSTTSTGAILRTDTSTFTYNATTNTLTVTSSYAATASNSTNLTVTGPLSGSITGSSTLIMNLSTLGTSGQFILPTTEPTQPTRGSIYWNFSTGYLFIYNGSAWLNVQLTIGG
jgi:hypothetical protein